MRLSYQCVYIYYMCIRTSGGDLTSTRSKLVLPAPQISDSEIDEVVKLGAATSLVGGVMTPLIGGDTSFRGGMTPRQTPLQTLSQTPNMTPSRTPSRTPVRDQLSINSDISAESFDGDEMRHQQQQEITAQLKVGLGSLPAPKNDFEIVLPESEPVLGVAGEDEDVVEDAADVEERNTMEKRARGEATESALPYGVHVCLFLW